MAEAGAQAALRGYRLQLLYTLDRLLDAGADKILHLEGREDLDIYDRSGAAIEMIQVKALDHPLRLSDLGLDKKRPFFRRVLERESSTSHTRPEEKLVCFSGFGPNIANAFAGEGPDRKSVVAKLVDWGFSKDDALQIIATVKLIIVDETDVHARVMSKLGLSLAGCDPESAFDLLSNWLLKASENKSRLTERDAITRVLKVAKFNRARAALDREHESIVTLPDDDFVGDWQRLYEEFYRGVATRYQHIQACVDVLRPRRLQELHAAFQESKCVVLRGASGQGKSALAYRYLRDYVPAPWRYEVRLIDGSQHAISIAHGLFGHLNAIGGEAYVYVDVPAGGNDWVDLVRELSPLENVRFLISIREEDWRRTRMGATVVAVSEIELALERGEAKELYERLVEKESPTHVLGFEDAWIRFGAAGPLLEFSHFVVHNEMLERRLEDQVAALRDETRDGSRPPQDLRLLREIAIASSFGARVDLKALRKNFESPDLSGSLKLLEREYFVRTSDDGRYVEGLHPVRSSLLVKLLTDEITAPWGEAAISVLPSIREVDLTIFLLHAFTRRVPLRGMLLESLACLEVDSWAGVAGVLHALEWLSIDKYVSDNKAIIAEASEKFGQGWWLILPTNLAGLDEEPTKSPFEDWPRFRRARRAP